MMMRTRAFTLFELLIVIGVIALLLAVLLPTLSNARARAQQAGCVGLGGKVSGAMNGFTLANAGRFPSASSPLLPDQTPWVDTLVEQGFLKPAPADDPAEGPPGLRCPADTRPKPAGLNGAPPAQPTSYGMSLYLDGPATTGSPVRLAQVSAFGDKISFIETAPGYALETVAPMLWFENFPGTNQPLLVARSAFGAYSTNPDPNSEHTIGVTGEQHDGEVGVGFLDGSAEQLTFDEIGDVVTGVYNPNPTVGFGGQRPVTEDRFTVGTRVVFPTVGTPQVGNP